MTGDTIARSRTEESILTIAKGVSAATGEMLFRSLVEHLARALQADHAFIAELMGNNLDRVKTVAAYAHGNIVVYFCIGDRPVRRAVQLHSPVGYSTILSSVSLTLLMYVYILL